MSLDHQLGGPLNDLVRRTLDPKFIHSTAHREILALAPRALLGWDSLYRQQNTLLMALAERAARIFLGVAPEAVGHEFRQELHRWSLHSEGLYEVPATIDIGELRSNLRYGEWLLMFVHGLSSSAPDRALSGVELEQRLLYLARCPGVFAVVASLPDDVDWLIASMEGSVSPSSGRSEDRP